MFQSIVVGVSAFLLWIAVISYYQNFSNQARAYENLAEKAIIVKEDVDELSDSIKKMSAIINYRTIVNSKLAKIERGCLSLYSSPQKHIFANWYADKIRRLESELRATLEGEYIGFETYHLQEETNPLYNAFDGKDNDFFYAPHTCENIRWWLNPYGRAFVESLHQKVEQGKIHHIKRIFIYKNIEELYQPLVQLCFKLHKNDVYDFRIISKEEYAKIFHSEAHRGTFKMYFGVFGENFAWETMEGYEEDSATKSRFSMKREKVQFYKDFFEKLWNKTEEYSSKDDENISLPKNNMTDLLKLYEEKKRKETQLTVYNRD